MSSLFSGTVGLNSQDQILILQYNPTYSPNPSSNNLTESIKSLPSMLDVPKSSPNKTITIEL